MPSLHFVLQQIHQKGMEDDDFCLELPSNLLIATKKNWGTEKRGITQGFFWVFFCKRYNCITSVLYYVFVLSIFKLLYIVLGLRVAITQNYWCIVKLDKMNMQNIMGQFFSLESHRSKDLQQIMKLVWWQITFEYWIIWLDYWMYDKWLWTFNRSQ